MKKLKRYDLTFNSVFPYLQDNLSGGYTLCNRLLDLITFSDGHFFTLLPQDANLQNIYRFSCGEILPQYPEREIEVLKRKYIGRAIPTLQDELGMFIFKMINKNKLSCVFDDVVQSPTDPHVELFHSHGLIYNEEIYYLITPKNNVLETVLKCIEESNAIWHSLCILTEANFNEMKDKKLSLEKLDEICLKAQIIVVGAYDGEGYIFWERDMGNR
jgi:hypothetical protein